MTESIDWNKLRMTLPDEIEILQRLALLRQEPKLTQREALSQLTELMARLLHYAQRGEPNWQIYQAEEMAEEWKTLPNSIRDRYLSDPLFHQSVVRAVTMTVGIVHRLLPTERL